MLIRNKKTFGLGMIYTISFLGILAMIFAPIFEGENGLQFADNTFNKLAKGSSYFIPKVSKSVDKFVGKPFAVSIKLEKTEDIEPTSKLFAANGAKVETNDTGLKIEGDLGLVLKGVVRDADNMYKNDGQAVLQYYGYDEKKVLKNWWAALGKIEKRFKKEKLIAEAKVVSDVTKKAVEPGYNFYNIKAETVSKHAGKMSGLLVFYVIYTMWWGYAIFYLFDGLGLSTKKAKKGGKGK